MALIKFYQENNIWTVGDKVGLSAGEYFKKTDAGGKISICHELNSLYGGANGVVAVGLPTEFCDVNGAAYADLAAFKTATDAFFFSVAGAGSGVDSNGFLMLPNSSTGFRIRIGYRTGFAYAIDRELTETGFSGVENTDWENIGGQAIS